MRIKSLEDLLTAYEGAYPGDVAHTGTLPERPRLGYIRMNPEMPRVWAEAARRVIAARSTSETTEAIEKIEARWDGLLGRLASEGRVVVPVAAEQDE